MKLDVIETGAKPWYGNGLRFTCTQCGNCCTGPPGYVWISQVEIARLAAHLELSIEQTIDRHCRRVGSRISLREHRNPRGEYDCEFLREVSATREIDGQTIQYSKRICTIYPVRPLQCRTWPFWSENLSSQKAWSLAGRKCPGMNEGRQYSVDQIRQIRDAKDWPQRPPTSE